MHERHGSTSRPFRSFVYRRNRIRFLDKWGPFIGEHVASGPPPAAARRRPPNGRDGAEPTEDPPIVYVRRERDVLRAYVAELEARLDAGGQTSL